ncbi:MAG TPA: hypothetical protein VM553_21950 [Dongiaceae bacterium]|nr:hypothetical protein [Dongiaceae bacterium]
MAAIHSAFRAVSDTINTLSLHADASATVLTGRAVSRPMMASALQDQVRAWIEHIIKFSLGAAGAAALLVLLDGPGLPFLGAFSAGLGMLYLANLADVTRYRDAIFFIVPTLFIWGMLVLDHHRLELVALTWFTHVFIGFVGSFIRTSGGIAELRIWSLLLGISLVNLVYLASQFGL